MEGAPPTPCSKGLHALVAGIDDPLAEGAGGVGAAGWRAIGKYPRGVCHHICAITIGSPGRGRGR